jgi:hypothetical protein
MHVEVIQRFVTRQVLATAVLAAAAVLGACGSSLASSHGGHGGHESEAEEDATHEDGASSAATRGVALGEYQIRSYYPVDAQKSTVHFVLFASVPSERFAATQHFADEHEHKIRDQVIIATRMTPLAEYDQADLASFRRRIFMRLRRALPELAIDDVYVTDFTLIVKSL